MADRILVKIDDAESRTKKHITLSVPEEDILKVKIYAMKNYTTVSNLFHEWVQKYCSESV